MKHILKKQTKVLILVCVFSWISGIGLQAQTTIYGPSTANVNDVDYYSVNINDNMIFYHWFVYGGTRSNIQEQSVTVTWTSTGTNSVTYDAEGDWDAYYGTKNVSVSSGPPATPPMPTITKNCGNTVLTRGTPPSGETYYWQSTSYGTSTGNSASTITLTTGTVYYLRSLKSGQWSSARTVNYTIDQPTIWYADGDGDTYGDPFTTQYACSQPAGYVDNSDDLCPTVYSTNSNGCANCDDEDINRVITKTYDLGGTLKGHTKAYFNTLGKSIQTQTEDMHSIKSKDIVWATQTIYDSHGRPAFQSLSAPINDTDCLLYNLNFIKNSNNTIYGASDFETDPESPSPVGTQSNTLGWYYSSSNTSESYQDVTDYPFVRQIYSTLNPGSVLRTIGGNKVDVNGTDKWANGYTFTMPIAQELHYAYGPDEFNPYMLLIAEECSNNASTTGSDYLYTIVKIDPYTCATSTTYNNVYIMSGYLGDVNKIYKMDVDGDESYYKILSRASGIRDNSDYLAFIECGPFTTCSDALTEAVLIKGTKTISRDVHGVETVVFTDSDGKTLAAARSGNEETPSLQKYDVVSPIGEQGFVDIHIPVGCDGTVYFEGPTDARFDVYDLVTELKVKTNAGVSTYLNSGVYRVEEVDSNEYYKNPVPYVTINNGAIELINDQSQVAVKYKVNYYDYSLNYYDKAGRLTKSVQPLGFDDTLSLSTTTRNHGLESTFSYNTLGQLLSTTSPDEGTAEFAYRKDGQIRYSQNSKQSAASPKEISYTEYDGFGRPIESGVVETNTAISTLDPDGTLVSGTKKEQHLTVYDTLDTTGMHAALTASSIATSNYPIQKFVTGNVSKTYTQGPATTTTWYSYDVYGRVTWLVQKIEGLGTKTIDYTYDFSTGAVTKVDYQKHVSGERYVHKYTYNNVNELVKVETSTNGSTYAIQAEYEYYDNGALKRTEIAEDLQGIDYVYNLNGQLKAINSPQSTGFKDPGNDSPGTTGFKTDVFGMLIDYHNKDYSRTGTAYNGLKNASTNNQLNGNIGNIRWMNDEPAASTNIDTYKYTYNKNNWLKQADYGTSNAGATISFSQHGTNDYQVSGLTYDANGNIKSLTRKKNYNNGSSNMDDLTYDYYTSKPNQLKRI
ncbi:hypothetical protein, partial [Pontimicrobium aquaticum]